MFDFKSVFKNLLKNSIDELNRFLFLLFVLLFCFSFFVKNFYLDLLTLLIIFFFFYRIFSKNKSKRSRENLLYLKIKQKIFHPFYSKDKDKSHVYKKCRECLTILKLPLPKKRGLSYAKCPSCGNRVKVFSLKKEKIEKIKVDVIKKKFDKK